MASHATKTSCEYDNEDDFEDPVARCDEMLETLEQSDEVRDPSPFRQDVIEAGALPFRGEHASRLVRVLERFIQASRDSLDFEDRIAAGSAIRQLIAHQTWSAALKSCEELLAARKSTHLPVDLELEVVKMVVRKLAANPEPPISNGEMLVHELNKTIERRATPGFTATEDLRCAAVVLNAILALALLGDVFLGPSAFLGSQCDWTDRGLKADWFRQLIRQRAEGLMQEVARKFPKECQAGRPSERIQRLDELARLAEG